MLWNCELSRELRATQTVTLGSHARMHVLVILTNCNKQPPFSDGHFKIFLSHLYLCVRCMVYQMVMASQSSGTLALLFLALRWQEEGWSMKKSLQGTLEEVTRGIATWHCWAEIDIWPHLMNEMNGMVNRRHYVTMSYTVKNWKMVCASEETNT